MLDWLQLLIIPFLIFFLGVGFTGIQNRTSLQIAQDNRAQDLRIAQDIQEDATLKAYLDDITKLYSDMKLNSQDPKDAEVAKKSAIVARAKTLTALRQLKDKDRKGYLIQFLSEAHLITSRGITGHNPTIPLQTANLEGANLTVANLRGADLTGADLAAVDLSHATLQNARLMEATLWKAKLGGADLRGAELRGADLSRATLDNTLLKGAQYNTKDIVVKDPQGNIVKISPTIWSQGLALKAAGAIEKNTL